MLRALTICALASASVMSAPALSAETPHPHHSWVSMEANSSWGGAVVKTPAGQIVNQSSTTFVVPRVRSSVANVPQTVSVWTGVGGYFAAPQPLYQDGVDVQVSGSGAEFVTPWVETVKSATDDVTIYPKLSVAVGQRITATTSWAKGQAIYDLTNDTTRQHVRTVVSAPTPPRGSAESVIESPLYYGTWRPPIPNFGALTMTNNTFDMTNAGSPVHLMRWFASGVNLGSVTNGNVLATVGPLAPTNAFTLTYRRPW